MLSFNNQSWKEHVGNYLLFIHRQVNLKSEIENCYNVIFTCCYMLEQKWMKSRQKLEICSKNVSEKSASQLTNSEFNMSIKQLSPRKYRGPRFASIKQN
jgi:hypothetical protein